ncbi:MAG: hypothetical protein EOO27_16220 [Comamonadaceae bacterium]|nr:MAG: hypothetical protein EOO27_16220 [Comamonadaceae bacterium]
MSFTAWFATALEITKSVFTIASAGFGLCVNILLQAATVTPWVGIWTVLAAFMFAASAGTCIWIFSINKHLASAYAIDDEPGKDEHLNKLQLIARCRDAFARSTFVLGVVFSFFALVAKVYLENGGK